MFHWNCHCISIRPLNFYASIRHAYCFAVLIRSVRSFDCDDDICFNQCYVAQQFRVYAEYRRNSKSISIEKSIENGKFPRAMRSSQECLASDWLQRANIMKMYCHLWYLFFTWHNPYRFDFDWTPKSVSRDVHLSIPMCVNSLRWIDYELRALHKSSSSLPRKFNLFILFSPFWLQNWIVRYHHERYTMLLFVIN